MIHIRSHFKSNAQFLRFLLVGLLNTGFSYCVYAIFIYFEQSYVVASLASLILGMVFSFFTQSVLVFKNTDKGLFWVFLLNWMVIYLCVISIITIFIRMGINEYWSGLLAIPPMAILSFLTQKFIVFRRRSI